MLSERYRANCIYATVFLVAITVMFFIKYDKVSPTQNYIDGYVVSITPKPFTRIQKELEGRAHVQLENGSTIIENASLNGKLRVGSKITFRIYESNFTGRVKYVKQ